MSKHSTRNIFKLAGASGMAYALVFLLSIIISIKYGLLHPSGIEDTLVLIQENKKLTAFTGAFLLPFSFLLIPFFIGTYYSLETDHLVNRSMSLSFGVLSVVMALIGQLFIYSLIGITEKHVIAAIPHEILSIGNGLYLASNVAYSLFFLSLGLSIIFYSISMFQNHGQRKLGGFGLLTGILCIFAITHHHFFVSFGSILFLVWLMLVSTKFLYHPNSF